MAKKKQEAQVIAPSKNRRVENRVDEKTLTFYANNTHFDVSNFDVKMRFGQIESATANLVSVKDVVHVYMSHDHFRAFMTAMTTAAGNIERVRAVKTDGD